MPAPRSGFFVPGLTLGLIVIVGIGVMVFARAKTPAPAEPASVEPPSNLMPALPSVPQTQPAPPTPASPPPEPPPPPPTEGVAPRERENERGANGLSKIEASAMDSLRSFAKSDPEKALVLAGTLHRRFPTSPAKQERDSLVIDALVKQGHIGKARDRAEDFLRDYPDGNLPFTSVASPARIPRRRVRDRRPGLRRRRRRHDADTPRRGREVHVFLQKQESQGCLRERPFQRETESIGNTTN